MNPTPVDFPRRRLLASIAGTAVLGIKPAVSATTVSNFRKTLDADVSILDFGAAGNGTADDTEPFIAFVNFIAANGVTGHCPAGIYLFNSKHLLFSNLHNITIKCDVGAVFRDAGRIITGANGLPKRIPWGIEFVSCKNIEIIGGQLETFGDLGGASAGFFDSSNYMLRNPVLGFVKCESVKLIQFNQGGDPGVGIHVSAYHEILSKHSLNPNAIEYSYLNLRSAFLNFLYCENILVQDNEIIPDNGGRERFTFAGCTNVSVIRPKSISKGRNFASLGKVINCKDVMIEDCKVKDMSDGSLWDLIGYNITLKNSDIDYPNGKLADISHEWGPANGPSDNISVINCSTTGRGVTNVIGLSTADQVRKNPITNVTVRNIKTGIGRTDWLKKPVEWVRLSTVRNYSIHECQAINSSLGYPHHYDGGQVIDIYDSSFRWTVSSALIAPGARNFHVPSRMSFHNCDIDADSNQKGIAQIGITGASGAVIRFYNCRIKNSVFATRNPAIEFIDCVMTLVTVKLSGSSTVKYINCIIDSVKKNSDSI